MKQRAKYSVEQEDKEDLIGDNGEVVVSKKTTEIKKKGVFAKMKGEFKKAGQKLKAFGCRLFKQG